MQLEGLKVVVCGGAIGGASVALLLARAGARVRLVEQVATPRAVGAGIAIAENGEAVLDGLGFGAVLARGRRVPGIRVVDGRGRPMMAPPAPVPRITMLRRATLHEALLDAVAAAPGIETRFGVAVVRAERAGAVTVREGNREESLRADLVVGADGVRSVVRAAMHAATRVEASGIRYVRALVTNAKPLEAEAWTAAGIFGSFATDDGAYLYASCGKPALRAAVEARDLERFRATWRAAYPAAAELLEAIPSWDALLVNEVVRVTCSSFADGRLALVGDAAHAMAPNLGQGANSALVDAAVLVDELRRAASLEEGLAAYSARRLKPVHAVATLSSRLGRLAEVTHPVTRTARDRLLLPLLERMTTAAAMRQVLQEDPAALAAIGRL